MAAAELAAVILAGGRGTRMGGADKGLLVYRQRPLIEWVLEAIRPQAGEVLISANRNSARYAEYGCRVLCDSLADYPGPLAGVLSAMDATDVAWLLVVPCDTPHLPADLAASLRLAADTAGTPIAVACDAARTHHAVMLVQTRLADSLRAYLAAGGRAIKHWQAPHAPARAVFPAACLRNLNTRDALDAP